MYAAAEAMEFERAATIRDRIGQMRESIGKPVDAVQERESLSRKRRGKKKKTGDPAAVERPRAAAETRRVTEADFHAESWFNGVYFLIGDDPQFGLNYPPSR